MVKKSSTKYLLRGHDFKAKQWGKHSSSIDIELVEGSRLTFCLKIIKLTLSERNREIVVIQRYLNDYRSFGKSLLLLFGDVLLNSYLKIRCYKLVWICHNLDRESLCHHKKLLSLRRYLLLKSCSQILVTDPLFVKYARLLFKGYESPINSITFGVYAKDISIHNQEDRESKKLGGPHSYLSVNSSELFEVLNDNFQKAEYLGYCGGATLPKKKYLKAIPELLNAAKSQGVDLRMLVITNLKRNEDPELYDFLNDSDDVLFINFLMSIDLHKLAEYIDFYWMGYDDISIPYSIYSAASTHTPVLTMPLGILPLLLGQYKIGLTVNKTFSNLDSKLFEMKTTSFRFKEFIESHTWKSLEQSLQTRCIKK